MTLSGKTLVFTGTLSTARAAATKMAEAAGATVTKAVSGKTDILVAGTGAGKKADDAAAKGVTVIDEDAFLAMCAGKGAGKKTKAAPAKAAKEPPAKKARAAPKKAAKVESEDDEEEEAPAPKKAKSAPKAKAAPKAAAPQASGGGGSKPVDREVPNKDSYTIYQDFAVKLNQTNIGGNNNKFYIINLLEKGGSYAVWTRWGRVGESGQNNMDNQGSNLAGAIKAFEKKFKDKTVNHWNRRANFVKHNGKYQLVETEEQGDGGGDDDVPLGRLTKAQIEKGQGVLHDIEAAINKKASRGALCDLSSQFFSLIPTDFGRKVPEPILSIDVLKAKEALLEFYLRMGFEDMSEDKGMTPIAGVMDMPCPATLAIAAKGICASFDVDRCVTKGQEMEGTQVGGPKKKCSKELYASILLYTSNAIYAALNKALRDENRSAVKKYFNYLRLFMEAFDTLPQQKAQLWRGISVDLHDQYKVGSTVTWWSVSSCTSDEKVARGFAAGCGGNCTMLTLNAKTACDISQITFYSHEKESLLAPGTQLKVLSNKRVGKVTEIHLEEVGRCLN